MPSSASPRAPAATMSAPVVVWMLTLLLGIQPITTDLYLPGLPTLAEDLGASVGAAQLTLSALIICFGLAQLVCGPLADRFGRRPVLLGGMALYTVASLFSVFAPSIEWLIGWRALQGAAMAAAVTCGRSIVRDLFEPHDGARVMSRALGGLGVIAMLSPLLGGILVQWTHWRIALLVLALFGAATLAFIAWRFEETVPRRNPRATRLGPLLRSWGELARHPGFRAWTALMSFSYGGLFVILAASSFVYIDVLGSSRIGYGVIMASNSLAYIAGTLLCRRLLTRHGLRGAVKRAGVLTLSGGVTAAVLSLAGVHTVWAILVPQWAFAMGHGIHQPCGQVGAVGPFPEKAGTAASLSGFMMMVMAFAVGLWLGRQLNGTVYPLTLGLGAFSIGIATVAWTLVQRHGEPTLAATRAQPA
ncbi:multidrug effflux MFS transporter [Piscinibacter sp.]|uniref:multidrug effflux MFS transporter n=1 Tax=Piscinibacter sp. TaxID=1903157 RepID=UPI002C47547D|nr:multidrug effflux MFS transporter [Albitalea sp.]HUG23187.1 multidrug effflux MFS transporter [Albitalea sp.]